MAIIVHISDLHFGREVPTVVEGLFASLEAIQPDLIIVSGDLTQRAKHREFTKGVDFLQRLNYPYLIVPGNHDMAMYNLLERFFYPWRKWKRYIGADMNPVLELPDYIAIGVNTARRTGWHIDWSRGSINAFQLGHIARKLKNQPHDKLRLLVAHHPFWLPKAFERRHLIDGRDTALNSLESAGVDIVLSGHIHIAYTRVMQGIIISHTGTTLSNRLLKGHPNSFNVIRGNRSELQIDLMEWSEEHFSCSTKTIYERNKAGWQLLTQDSERSQ